MELIKNASAICLLLLGLAAPPVSLAAPAMLVNMIVSGKLTPSSDGKLYPVNGDTVLAVNAATGVTEGSAAFVSYGKLTGGVYTLIMANMPSTYNGTQLVLRLSHQNSIYPLLNSGSADAAFTFNGSFLPVQATMDLVAGSQVLSGAPTAAASGNSNSGYSGPQYIYITVPASGTPASSSTTASAAPTGTLPTAIPAPVKGDLNGDGVVNSLDINLLKQAISGQVPLDIITMDVNGDGVVNTRDLIDLIRIVRTANALTPGTIVVNPAAIIVAPAAITATPVSIIRPPSPIVQGRK